MAGGLTWHILIGEIFTGDFGVVACLPCLLIDDYICCWSKLWLTLCESLCLSLSHGAGGQWLFVGTSSFSIANLLLGPALFHSSALALCCAMLVLLSVVCHAHCSVWCSLLHPFLFHPPIPPQLLSQWAALSGCHGDAPGGPKRSGGGWNVAKCRWLKKMMWCLEGIVSH